MPVTYSYPGSFLADTVSGKLQNNNIYTIAKRNVEGQDMLYQSLKLTNGIWILAELRIQPGNPNYTVTFNLHLISDMFKLRLGGSYWSHWNTLSLSYSCLSSVGHRRFLSTSTRCMTLC